MSVQDDLWYRFDTILCYLYRKPLKFDTEDCYTYIAKQLEDLKFGLKALQLSKIQKV